MKPRNCFCTRDASLAKKINFFKKLNIPRRKISNLYMFKKFYSLSENKISKKYVV